MTEQPPQPPPIEVHPTPTKEQLEALFRQILTVLGTGATLLGLTGWVGRFHDWIVYVPQAAAFASGCIAIGAIVYGQFVTWKNGKQKIRMEPFVPDSVAKMKK